MPPGPEGVRFLEQPVPVLTRISASLVGVVILQVLTLILIVAIFVPSPLRFWLMLCGVPIAIANLMLRFGKRLHEPKAGLRPGKIVVAIMFVVFTAMVGVGIFGIWGSLGITVPVILVTIVAMGVRGSVSTSRWIEDNISAGFQEYSIWPVLIGFIVSVARLWTMRPWDVVTIFALSFLGWWSIQLIGDLILAWTSIVAIGHRHKLDGIESRRRDREHEQALDR